MAIFAPLTPTQYEPKKAYNWIIEIDGIDTYTARSTKRPTISFAEVQIPFLNLTRKLAGKFEFDNINLTLHDPVDADEAGKMLEWIVSIGDPADGTRYPASLYKKDFRLKLLSGAGTVLETWQIVGAWPQSTNFGDLDYSSDEPVMIEVSFSIDRAYRL